MIFNYYASFRPFSRLFWCSLVLNHNMVAYGERGEGLGAMLELFMLE